MTWGKLAHEVAAPHLRRLHPERPRNQVDAPFHDEAGREAAEGTCRRERGLVGHGHPDADVAGRQVIRVREIGGARERHDVAPVDAGAAVAGVPERTVAHRRDPPVGGGCDLDVVGLVALLAHGHEVLLARLDPAHRTGQHPRHVTDQRWLPIEGRLDAERAALIARSNDANSVGGDAELIRQGKAVDVRTLGRDPRREVAVGIPDRERAAGLERCHAGAVDTKAPPHHDIGCVDQLLDLRGVPRLVLGVVAARERAGEHDVVVPVLVDERRVGPERGLGVDDSRKRLVLDLDQLGGVLRNVSVPRDDGRDRLAVELHLVDGKRPEGRIAGRERRQDDRQRQRTDFVLDVLAGDHRHDTGHGAGLADVDRQEPGVGVRAAHEGKVERARHSQIGDVAAAAGGQTKIFLALQGVTQPGRLGPALGHGAPPLDLR